MPEGFCLQIHFQIWGCTPVGYASFRRGSQTKRPDVGIHHGPQLFLKRRALLSNALLRLAREVFNALTNSRLSLESKRVCIGNMIVLGHIPGLAKRHDPADSQVATDSIKRIADRDNVRIVARDLAQHFGFSP